MSSQPGTQRAANPWYAAGAIGLAAAFLLCGYEFVRSTSTNLFLEAYGKDRLPQVMALVPVGVVLALYAYGRLLSGLGPRRTLMATSLFSALAIALCYVSIRLGSRPATGVLYIVREVYVVLLIEQYWSFLNSTLGLEQAKKLNGPICGLASLGSVAGAAAVAAWSVPLGTETMLVFAASLVLPAAFCSAWAYRSCGEPTRSDSPAEPSADNLALRHFRASPTLFLLLLVILATQALSTVLDLAFYAQLHERYPDKDVRNAVSGEFWTVVNLASAAGQFVFTPLLMRWVPLRFLHAAIPIVNGLACGYFLHAPSWYSAGFAYMLFKTLDYSLFRAAKETLYIPFSFDVRYRAKQVIDVFGYRFGKGGTALAITLLKGAGWTLTLAMYGYVALAATVLWLVLIVPTTKARPAPQDS